MKAKNIDWNYQRRSFTSEDYNTQINAEDLKQKTNSGDET